MIHTQWAAPLASNVFNHKMRYRISAITKYDAKQLELQAHLRAGRNNHQTKNNQETTCKRIQKTEVSPAFCRKHGFVGLPHAVNRLWEKPN